MIDSKEHIKRLGSQAMVISGSLQSGKFVLRNHGLPLPFHPAYNKKYYEISEFHFCKSVRIWSSSIRRFRYLNLGIYKFEDRWIENQKIEKFENNSQV